MEPLHVTLIRPPTITSPQAMVGTPASPSLALLAAFLERHGYAVTAIDAQGEALSQYTPFEGGLHRIHGLTAEQIVARIPPRTRLIGFSCMFSNDWIYHRRVIELAAERFPGVPIIVGGEHATAAADYILRVCPGVVACALGEGEETLLEVLQALERGTALDTINGLMVRGQPGAEIVRTAPRKRRRALDELPWPDWDAVPLRNYLPYPGSALHDLLRARHAFPPEGPEYDRMLLANGTNDYWGPRSWNEHISDRQLQLLLIGGSALFYLSQYALRPWRALESIGRMAMGRPITFIERVVANSLGRFRFMFGRKASLPTGSGAAIDLPVADGGPSRAHGQRSVA